MKRTTALLLFILAAIFSYAQNDTKVIADSITAEGKKMYQSEMASWYGTDIFLEAYKDRENIGGYLSYTDGDTARCIFFSKSAVPVVIGVISFDETYNVATAVTNYTERSLNETEKSLYAIRKKALDIINHGDTLFKHYNNTSYNLIPLISNGEKKVYVLTGPKKSGVVIFGNDYLLRFNEQNELVSKKPLHMNLISMTYGDKAKDGEKVVGGAHTHLPETGEFMTATDICTLMLYAKFAKWEQHVVVSEHYINMWNCKTNQLVVIPR
jgi:hypothetical protein